MKNLYLPGTNKNVGYLDKHDVMKIYKRHMKYFPMPKTLPNVMTTFFDWSPFSLLVRENGTESYVELRVHGGWWLDVDTKEYVFNNCRFKVPDNLNLIERMELYRNWDGKKKR